MSNFAKTLTLPQEDCTRDDFYDLIEQIDPTTEVVDDLTIGVTAGKILAKNAVPRWLKVSKVHTDFQTAGLTLDILLTTLPGGAVVHAVRMKHSIQFAGCTTYTISVGDAVLATEYTAAGNVHVAVGDTVETVTSTMKFETHNAGGTQVRAYATSTVENLDQSSAGAVDFWILWSATE